MTTFRRFISYSLCRIFGRNFLSRLGRFLLNSGRLDGENDQRYNGEFDYLRRVVKLTLQTHKSVNFFDIGANRGIVTKFASEVIGKNGVIYAAEPCNTTFETLKREVSGIQCEICLINAAFSDVEGTGVLQVVSPNAGTNSLVSGIADKSEPQKVDLLTLDSFAKSKNIQRIDFVKIDTEGHDFSVLCGCKQLLAENRVRCIQFEYNWRWIGQRNYLRDVFDLVSAYSTYRIGKVTYLGIELYEIWRSELETLVENNYTIIHEDLICSIPVIKPWFK